MRFADFFKARPKPKGFSGGKGESFDDAVVIKASSSIVGIMLGVIPSACQPALVRKLPPPRRDPPRPRGSSLPIQVLSDSILPSFPASAHPSGHFCFAQKAYPQYCGYNRAAV